MENVMNHKLLLTFLCLIPLIVFCQVKLSNVSMENEVQTMMPDNVAADTLIEMERTICYGTCPSYTLRIQGNGKVIFNGKEFVAHKGRAVDQISRENFNKLIQLANDIDFMSIPTQPECESWMTDHSSVFLTVKIDGESNSVTHYLGCRGFDHEEGLYRFEEAIDSLSGAHRWIENE